MDSDDEIFLTRNTFSQEPFFPSLNLEELVGDFRKVSERDSIEVEKKENCGRNIVVVCDTEVEERKESRIPANAKVNTSWAVRCWEEWAIERNVKVKKNSSKEKYYEVNLRQKYKSTDEDYHKNCAELYKSDERISGVYTIDPDGSGAFDVLCDQTTAGGGWTVFQKRLDGSVDFYRSWADYKNGFGNLNGEFWLGLDKIYRLTNSERYQLRVDLEDIEGKTAHAEYDMFAITSERTKYQLSIGTYSGTAGDSLAPQRGQPFSTKDQDNDSSSGNCAVNYKGAWWYEGCHHSNLNGLYHHGAHSSYADGVNWHHWKGYKYSVKRAEMKIKPVKF